jgi:hypothetical protein
MKKVQAGLLFGILAGLIDITPMVLQKLNWDANLSAFSLWVVAGFLISTSALKLPGILKGLLIVFLVLFPTAVLIAYTQPMSLIPITVMTLILGSALGYVIERF